MWRLTRHVKDQSLVSSLASSFGSYASLPATPAESSSTEKAVYRWLETCSDQEVMQVLQHVAQTRPEQFKLASTVLRVRNDEDDEAEWMRLMQSQAERRPAATAPPPQHVEDNQMEEIQVEGYDYLEPQDVRLEPLLPESADEVLFHKRPSQHGAPSLQRRSTILEALAGERNKEGVPLVQFSALYYFSNENDMYVDVDVLRMGRTDVVSKVAYATRDLTAVAGRTYIAQQGVLQFEVGEVQKVIRIALIDNELWDPTLEFYVELLPENHEGCMLGRHFWQAVVKVVDDDAFPTNGYKQQLIPITWEKIEALPMWGLLFEYFRMNFNDPLIKWGTVKLLLVDLIRNWYLVLKLLISQLVIDRVLHQSQDIPFFHERRKLALAMAVLCMVLPLALLHFLDYRKYTWRTSGLCRGILQKALVRKFLSMEQDSREELDPVSLNMSVLIDSHDLAMNGYMNAIKFVSAVGQMIMIIMYQLVVPPLLGKSVRHTAILPPIACAVFMCCFLGVRKHRTTRALEESFRQQVMLSDFIHLASQTFRLLADYNKQSFFMEKFQEQTRTYGQAVINMRQVQENNTYFQPWVTTLACSAYTFLEGTQVINGDVSLGMFLMDLAIIVQFGTELGDVYDVLADIQSTFPPLKRLTRFLNLQVDIIRRMHFDRLSRERSQELRTALQERGPFDCIFDELPLQLDSGFRFARSLDSPNSSLGHESNALPRTMVDIPQGKLVSFVGRRGEGKTTLLKMLGRVILPKGSPNSELAFYVPAHLRVLHVSQEPLFFRGSLYDNLVFGIDQDQPEGRMSRVLKICSRLGLTADLMSVIQSGHRDSKWNKVLSLSSLHLLHIARALIANYEVLCIHKPTLAFDEVTSRTIMEMLKEFVSQRGVEMDLATYHLRRPRTCLFTSSKAYGVEMADLVYNVSKSDGIQALDIANFSVELLG